MRLHRFYINDPIGEKEEVKVYEPRLLHQWNKVLRLRPAHSASSGQNDRVILFDGTGFEFEAEVLEMSRNSATLKILSREERSRNLPEVTLYQSLIKKDKFEWVAEKATELGVARIVPVVAERSEKTGVNMERLRKIVIEASEHSGRVDLPELSETRSLIELVTHRPSEHPDYGRESVLDIVLHTGKELPSVSEVLESTRFPEVSENTLNPVKSLCSHGASFQIPVFNLFIGPEGGWSEEEVDMFEQDERLRLCTMGPQILRAETSAVAGLSKVLLV